MCIRERVSALPGGVVLEPVCGGVSEAHEVGDADGWYAGITVRDVAGEARNAQSSFRAGLSRFIEVIECVCDEVLTTNTDIVHHIRRDGLRVATDPVAGLHRDVGVAGGTRCSGYEV